MDGLLLFVGSFCSSAILQSFTVRFSGCSFLGGGDSFYHRELQESFSRSDGGLALSDIAAALNYDE